MGAQPATLRRHARYQPRRPGALRLRAARRACASRPLQAPAGPAPDAGGARQYQGSARYLRQGRAGEPSRDAPLHPRRSARARLPAWATCTCSAISPTRRPRPRARSGRTSSSSRPTSRRAPRARSASAARGSSEVRPRRGLHVRRRLPAGDRDPRAAGDAGRIPPRRLAGERRRSVGGMAEGQSRPPAARRARPCRRRATRRACRLIRREQIISLPEGAPVAVRPTPRFYRWTAASMWTPGPFESRPVRAFYYITDVDPAWPPARQDEHLRDFNYGALWSISIHEVFPGTSCITSICARSSPRCASRSSFPRPRLSKAGLTTANR